MAWHPHHVISFKYLLHNACTAETNDNKQIIYLLSASNPVITQAVTNATKQLVV